MSKVVAVVPSAGLGLRMRLAKKRKPFIKLNGTPIMARTLRALENSKDIDEIVLVVEKGSLPQAKGLIRQFKFRKIKSIVAGGATRAESVRNGLKAVSCDCGIVLIHDIARPFIDRDTIRRSIEAARRFGACVVAVRAKSTIKEVRGDGFVKMTPPRDGMWEAQTPQAFKRDVIVKAYDRLLKPGSKFTDDSQLVEKLNKPVRVVEGSYNNIKITTPEDLVAAEAISKGQR